MRWALEQRSRLLGGDRALVDAGPDLVEPGGEVVVAVADETDQRYPRTERHLGQARIRLRGGGRQRGDRGDTLRSGAVGGLQRGSGLADGGLADGAHLLGGGGEVADGADLAPSDGKEPRRP